VNDFAIEFLLSVTLITLAIFMRNTVTSLPGIKSIGYVDCEMLIPNVVLRGICSMDVPILEQVSMLDFCGTPTCSCKREYQNNGKSETATLKFSCLEELPLHKHLGFVVVDTNGQSFLIGSREKCFPTVTATADSGAPSGDAAITSYEVQWKSIKSLIPCII
jgi:hypothetical protein